MKMKKFMNAPETVTDEELVGLGLAYPDILNVDGHLVISKDLANADRVTIVTYGGSGHEPAQAGFVGKGMLDIQQEAREHLEQLDYENPDTLDLPLIKQCLRELSETGKTTLPVYDFSAEKRSDKAEPIDLQGGVCLVEGIHALNPELTGLVKGDDIYRIYAGLREEYCIDGRRVINTQDIRLCRRTLRDAATRGRSPAKTLTMWDHVLDGETRYIKGFKTTADFLLDTSFTYELGLISNLLGVVRRQFTLEGHNAELWDETARRFEHVAPLSLDLLPPDSMLREFYGGKV